MNRPTGSSTNRTVGASPELVLMLKICYKKRSIFKFILIFIFIFLFPYLLFLIRFLYWHFYCHSCQLLGICLHNSLSCRRWFHISFALSDAIDLVKSNRYTSDVLAFSLLP